MKIILIISALMGIITVVGLSIVGLTEIKREQEYIYCLHNTHITGQHICDEEFRY